MEDHNATNWFVDRRNHLFLGMCLCVHCFMFLLFAFLHIHGMVILNAVSISFYVYEIFIRKDFTCDAIVCTYFEIIFFSTIATLLVGRQAGFLLYIVGMISVVFYLAYSHENRRFLYQFIGCVMVLILVVAEPLTAHLFTDYKEQLAAYSRNLYFLNLVITLVTVIIISFLYAQELNRMTSELQLLNMKLDYKASHDQLTGLMNRNSMMQYMDSLKQQNVVVGMMDVDDFKKINDQYGHITGDLVLQTIAALLKENLPGYAVARWGGEEFLIVIANQTMAKTLQQLEHFHKQVQAAVIPFEDTTIRVHVTIGVSEGNLAEIDSIIAEADARLYKGKKSTKNCIISNN